MLSLLALFAHASTSVTLPPESPPEMQAFELPAAPVIDGRVDGDTAWNGVTPAQGFWQVKPDEGQPATQRTEVFVGYTTLVLEAAAESAEWEDLLDEIEREARQLGERGLSTRDIGAKLVKAFGVPRNVAYDFGLRFGRAEDRS